MAKVVTHVGKLESLGGFRHPILKSVSVDEEISYKIEIADATTDESLAFGGVATASIFYITSDQDVTVKIAGSATAQTISANGAILMFDTSVTAATISNASGSTANIQVFIAGT